MFVRCVVFFFWEGRIHNLADWRISEFHFWVSENRKGFDEDVASLDKFYFFWGVSSQSHEVLGVSLREKVSLLFFAKWIGFEYIVRRVQCKSPFIKKRFTMQIVLSSTRSSIRGKNLIVIVVARYFNKKLPTDCWLRLLTAKYWISLILKFD